jgi:hypothetical protein
MTVSRPAARALATRCAAEGAGVRRAARAPRVRRAARYAALAVACALTATVTLDGSAAAKAAGPPRGTTAVARVRHSVTGYEFPGRRAIAKVPASWYGYPSILPVIGTRPGWVRVRLAQRPDGSTAWIPASAVTLGTTPYAIVINLTTTHLHLYYHGRSVLYAPAGVGSPDDPTVTGHFFVAFFEPPPVPNVGYGPFILVTSAHSNSIRDWEGFGDAVMGIHGPLGEDREIGTTGARISHGCIRLHVNSLRLLRRLPPGTPITIIPG